MNLTGAESLRRSSLSLTVLLVITGYMFIASAGTFAFRRRPWNYPYNARPGLGYYSSLGEGFLHGRLTMAHEADPALSALPDPYDYDLRNQKHVSYLWDASFFHGKYYLYFSPVPLLVFYMPFRLIAREWPPDNLAAAFFATWAFIMAAAFVVRALPRLPLRRLVPWLLLLGFGNVTLFTLDDVSIYEVAILAGTAMSATWAYLLLRFIDRPGIGSATWLGVWLALAIAARPNLVVLVLCSAAPVLFTPSPRRSRVVAAFAAPLVVIALLMMAYNYERFGNPLELGIKYQLTYVPMREHRVCSICTPREAARFVNGIDHYVFWPVIVNGEFPYVDLSWNRMDPEVSFRGSQQIVGVFQLIPLTVVGSIFGSVFFLRRNRDDDSPGRTTALYVLAGSWLVLGFLASCWWVTARYSLDFMFLMTAASIVLIEASFDFLNAAGVRVGPLRSVAVVLALYSITIGCFLGFRGPDNAFARQSPDLFRRLVDAFYHRL